jgi:hypothetical protein
MSDQGSPVAGWYPDPEVPGGERYWDGVAWTEHRRAAPSAGPWGAPPPGVPSWQGPGAGAGAGVAQPPVDTWLWQSIVATILCCQPLGIVAIVFSAQAGSARDAGDLVLAQRRAGQARTWTLAAVGAGVAVWVLVFVIAGLGAFATGW